MIKVNNRNATCKSYQEKLKSNVNFNVLLLSLITLNKIHLIFSVFTVTQLRKNCPQSKIKKLE